MQIKAAREVYAPAESSAGPDNSMAEAPQTCNAVQIEAAHEGYPPAESSAGPNNSAAEEQQTCNAMQIDVAQDNSPPADLAAGSGPFSMEAPKAADLPATTAMQTDAILCSPAGPCLPLVVDSCPASCCTLSVDASADQLEVHASREIQTPAPQNDDRPHSPGSAMECARPQSSNQVGTVAASKPAHMEANASRLSMLSSPHEPSALRLPEGHVSISATPAASAADQQQLQAGSIPDHRLKPWNGELQAPGSFRLFRPPVHCSSMMKDMSAAAKAWCAGAPTVQHPAKRPSAPEQPYVIKQPERASSPALDASPSCDVLTLSDDSSLHLADAAQVCADPSDSQDVPVTSMAEPAQAGPEMMVVPETASQPVATQSRAADAVIADRQSPTGDQLMASPAAVSSLTMPMDQMNSPGVEAALNPHEYNPFNPDQSGDSTSREPSPPGAGTLSEPASPSPTHLTLLDALEHRSAAAELVADAATIGPANHPGKDTPAGPEMVPDPAFIGPANQDPSPVVETIPTGHETVPQPAVEASCDAAELPAAETCPEAVEMAPQQTCAPAWDARACSAVISARPVHYTSGQVQPVATGTVAQSPYAAYNAPYASGAPYTPAAYHQNVYQPYQAATAAYTQYPGSSWNSTGAYPYSTGAYYPPAAPYVQYPASGGYPAAANPYYGGYQWNGSAWVLPAAAAAAPAVAAPTHTACAAPGKHHLSCVLHLL